MNQGALAEALGVDLTTVSKWERGVQGISEGNFKDLCRVLGKPPEYFITPEAPKLPASISDPRLLALIVAWPELPESIRQAVVLIAIPPSAVAAQASKKVAKG